MLNEVSKVVVGRGGRPQGSKIATGEKHKSTRGNETPAPSEGSVEIPVAEFLQFAFVRVEDEPVIFHSCGGEGWLVDEFAASVYVVLHRCWSALLSDRS
jgi:hypothetical protein